MAAPLKYYKIRNIQTNKYYKSADVWTVTGKVFHSLGHVRTMLTNRIRNKEGLPAHWRVIEYEVTEVSEKPLHEVITSARLLEIIDGVQR